MAVEQAVPSDLASQTPGAELAALLEHLDVGQVADGQIVEVLRAVQRQASHLHAMYWAAMVEIGRREPPRKYPSGKDRAAQAWRALDSWHWATHQISAALTLSRRRTDDEYGVARQLVTELPLVWQALSAGQLDPAKAKVFASYLIDLTGAQSELICRRLLPHAPRWTIGQLAHRLLREILAIDPGYTRRRYEKAALERGVWGYLAEDGTAVLTAHGLNPGEAASAAERLEQLAAAVRAAGHSATEAQLRADLFVRLLDGRYAGFSSDQIVAAMLADVGSAAATRAADAGAGAGSAAADQTAAGADSAHADNTERTRAPGAHQRSAPTTRVHDGQSPIAADGVAADRVADAAAAAPASDGAAAGGAAAGPAAEDSATDPVSDRAKADGDVADLAAAEPGPARSVAAEPTASAPIVSAAPGSVQPPNPEAGEPPSQQDQPLPARRAVPQEGARTGIEVRIGLSTLLGLDDHPAELPGWGPIDADSARLLVERQHAVEWRFAVLEDEGYLVLGGLTRRRPVSPGGRRGAGGARPGRCRGGVVEIHVRAEVLTDLARRSGLPREWVAVVADIARQYAGREVELAKLDADPGARFPNAGLRRHVQMRDRTCVAPGCRRPARKAEVDHTREHALGGETVRANTEPLCLGHHMMKHLDGWTLVQPEPGRFYWRSPLGQRYWTRGEPVAPDLPEPLPGPDEESADTGSPEASGEVGPIFHPSEWRKLLPPEPPPEPPEPCEVDDAPPPF